MCIKCDELCGMFSRDLLAGSAAWLTTLSIITHHYWPQGTTNSLDTRTWSHWTDDKHKQMQSRPQCDLLTLIYKLLSIFWVFARLRGCNPLDGGRDPGQLHRTVAKQEDKIISLSEGSHRFIPPWRWNQSTLLSLTGGLPFYSIGWHCDWVKAG